LPPYLWADAGAFWLPAGLAPLASLFFCLSCCFRFSVATNRQPTKQQLALLFSNYFASGAN
jgi:hypothetical protein